MTNYIYLLSKYYEKYLTKDSYYLIAMTIYHVEILLFITLLGIEYNTHTFLPMITPNHAGGLDFLNYHFSLSNFNAIFYTILILIVDFAFLFIIKKELKHYENTHHTKLSYVLWNCDFLNLTTKKIIIIELLVFYLSIGNPFMRASLYFLSFNTIQIYVIYRIIFKLKIFNPIFILGAYISIIQLFVYPFWVLLWLKIKIG